MNDIISKNIGRRNNRIGVYVYEGIMYGFLSDLTYGIEDNHEEQKILLEVFFHNVEKFYTQRWFSVDIKRDGSTSYDSVKAYYTRFIHDALLDDELNCRMNENNRLKMITREIIYDYPKKIIMDAIL